MFRTLLTTTALVAILQAGAFAQDTMATDPAKPVDDPSAASQTTDPGSADAGSTMSEETPAADTAQTETAPAGDDPAATASAGAVEGYYSATEGQILANKLIGKTVYNNETEEAESIGSVNDVVISAEGEAEAVIIGVGGFLGMGEKNVAIEFDRVTWVGEQGDERIVVQTSKEQLEAAPTFDTAAMASVDETQEAVPGGDVAMAPADPAAPDAGMTPAAPQDETAMAPADPAAPQDETATAPADPAASQDETAAAPADPAAPQDETATAPADPAAPQDETAEAPADPAAPQDETATAPADPAAPQDETAMTDEEATDTETTTGAISGDPAAQDDTAATLDTQNFETVEAGDVSADNLMGAAVYNADQESIGEVSDVILSGDGQVEAFVVDVGGFLGIGEKSVAIGSQDLEFKRDEGGNLVVLTPFTEQQLEQQAAYEEDMYKSDPESGALRAPRT